MRKLKPDWIFDDIKESLSIFLGVIKILRPYLLETHAEILIAEMT